MVSTKQIPMLRARTALEDTSNLFHRALRLSEFDYFGYTEKELHRAGSMTCNATCMAAKPERYDGVAKIWSPMKHHKHTCLREAVARSTARSTAARRKRKSNHTRPNRHDTRGSSRALCSVLRARAPFLLYWGVRIRQARPVPASDAEVGF
jgi:hypothetical protein